MESQVTTRVILPKMLWSIAKDEDHLHELINTYMKRYRGYEVVAIGKYYALCERG